LRYGPNGVGQAEHTRQAARTLGVQDVRVLGFPDQKLDTLPSPRSSLHSSASCGSCGRRSCTASSAATRTAITRSCSAPCSSRRGRSKTASEAVYAFDTASSTEWGYPRTFAPDTWVEITETLEQKIAAMACYASEVRPYPHPRSLEGLRHRARAWGNQACLEAAEVFMTVRRTLRNGQTPG